VLRTRIPDVYCPLFNDVAPLIRAAARVYVVNVVDTFASGVAFDDAEAHCSCARGTRERLPRS